MCASVEIVWKFCEVNSHSRINPENAAVVAVHTAWHVGSFPGSAIGERATLRDTRFALACISLWILKNLKKDFGGVWTPNPPMKPKKTILCVDDNEQALSIRKVLLETRGYRVVACSNGQQALEAFWRGGIDLVLTDLVMSGLDGSQLINEIKQVSPQTPAVLISGRVKIYERDTQADVFLPKGMYEPAELLERIRLLLVRKRGPKRSIQLLAHSAARATVA
jgi:two-component system response regulator CpxR